MSPVRTTLGPIRVMVVAFLCIGLGHLALNTLFRSLPVNAIGVALVVAVMGWVLFRKNDVFSFILVLFVCSQFRIANNQGGLFNLAAFILLGLYLLQHKIREMRIGQDLVIGGALIVLLASNSLGVVLRGPVSIFTKGLELVAFTGIILAFITASQLRLTEARIRTLTVVISCVLFWNLFVSLNQYRQFIRIKTPFLGWYQEIFYEASNSFGPFGSASMNGQFAMMMVVFLLPLICATVSRQKLGFKPLVVVGATFAGGLVIVLANMRGAALLAVAAVMLYLAVFSVFSRRAFRYAKYLTRLAVAVSLFLFAFGAWVGLQDIQADFREIQADDEGSVLSGAALNRLTPWRHGIELLGRGSWIIGYGHGVAESNQLAWGGGGHLHNLYLALPTLYGWFGALAYVTLFVTVTWRLFRTVRRFSFDSCAVVAALGFLVSSGLFLVDEVKSGNAVHYINYPMIVFIWFGLGLAAVRTARFERAQAIAAGSVRSQVSDAETEPDTADEENGLWARA